MVKGYVVNNTGRSKHIFKRTVYPGQTLDLEYIRRVLGSQVPDDNSFVDWLEKGLPSGWEINVTQPEKIEHAGGRQFKETLTAKPEVAETPEFTQVQGKELNRTLPETDSEDARPSLQYSTPRAIDKLTSRDIYNLRLKDNPKRVLKNVNSIHKLRRALTLCKNDSRKASLSRLIQQRIRELNITL